MARRAEEAVKQREVHVNSFLDFADALEDEDVIEWTDRVQAWEIDRSTHMTVAYTRTIRISPHCLKPVVNGLAPGAAVNENPV